MSKAAQSAAVAANDFMKSPLKRRATGVAAVGQGVSGSGGWELGILLAGVKKRQYLNRVGHDAIYKTIVGVSQVRQSVGLSRLAFVRLFTAVYDGLHPRHRFIMRDAGLVRGHGGFHLSAKPCVIGFRFLGRRKLGLDGGEFGHSARVSKIRGSVDWGDSCKAVGLLRTKSAAAAQATSHRRGIVRTG